MKKFYLIFIPILLMILLFGCAQDDQTQTTDDVAILAERNVRIAEAVRKDIYSGISTTGRIESEASINISPSLPLRVVKIHKPEGSMVKKGDLLIELDNVNLVQAEQTFLSLERNYNRMTELYRNDAIDQKSYEEIRTAYEVVKSSYEYTLDNTRIKAPIDGKIISISLKEGENYNSMMSPYLVKILSLDKMKAVTHLSDRDFMKTRIGMKAVVRVDALPEKDLTGHISFISTEADRFTGTFRCEIIIDDSSDVLRHNQFARVFVATEESKNAIVVPQTAIINGNTLFTVSNNMAHKKTVTTGVFSNDEVEITAGLEAGEQVIVLGNIGLSDNYPVNIIE